MQNVIDKYIKEKDEKGIILELYELGLTQKEIEEFIVETHKPYLRSKTILRANIIAYMSQSIDSLLHILSCNDCKLLFEKYLDIFWQAKEKNPKSCFKSYQYWQKEVLEATSKIVTIINIDRDRSKMKLHEFTEDVFTKIGKIIEKCIQPYLRILLYLENITKNENPSALDIKNLDFGLIVNELIELKIFNNLLRPPPWNLKLNDWRNIPKHDKYSVKDNKIICKYKKPLKEKEIVLYQPELWKLFLWVNNIFSILRLAHSLFFLDNMEEIKPYWENVQLRRESSILDLFNALSTFGFKVTNYSIENDIIKLTLKEVSKLEPDGRLNDLLFLVRPIWYKTRKRFINIEYYDFNEKLTYILEVNTTKRQDIFTEGVNEELLTFENIRECVILKDLR